MLKGSINFHRYFIFGFSLFLFLFEIPLASAGPQTLDEPQAPFVIDFDSENLLCASPTYPESRAAQEGATGHRDKTTIEALLIRIPVNQAVTWLLLNVRFLGLSVEQLEFQLLVNGGEEAITSIREELFQYFSQTWKVESNSIERIEVVRELSQLSPKEQARLTTRQSWPGYYDGKRRTLEQSPAIPCPPEKTDDIRAIEEALRKCNPERTPEVRCDCEEGTDSCAYFRPGHPPEIFLCPQNCEGTVKRLQSSWIHELIHALQYACNEAYWDSLECDTNIRLEYLAYLCQGKCSSIIDCCWAQAHSSSTRCYSHLWAVRQCFEGLYRRAPDWVDYAFMCCPNSGAPDSYSECRDIRDKNGADQADNVCDVYQDCFPLLENGIQDNNDNGICDNFECSLECSDSNENGIGDCWELIRPGGVTIVIPSPSCSDLEPAHGTCPEDSQSPSDRRIECIDQSDRQVIAYVCCRDENLCPPGGSPCWLPPDQCSVPQWCF